MAESTTRPPKVSVVMASYNHEKYVDHAVQSVLNQTFSDFEFIIVDDASSDQTAEKIRQFQDPRIHLTVLEKNQGQFVATNRGLQQARGEYIAILNSDDGFLPTKLEKQVAFLDGHPRVGAVFTDAQVIDEDGHPFTDKNHFYYGVFKEKNRTRHQWLHYFFHDGNCLCHPSVLTRKECHDRLGLYDARFANLADADFWVKLCLVYDLHLMEEPLTQFRVRAHEANMSGVTPVSKKRIRWEHSQVLKNFLKIQDPNELLQIFPEALAKLAPQGVEADLIPYYLAQMALERGATFYDYFALNILYTLLEDPAMAEKLETTCHFTYRDFIYLTGRRDPFNLLARMDAIAAKAELKKIKKTLVWRISKNFYKLRDRLTAPSTN